MQQIAMSWLIYSLTKSPLIMGVIMFTGFIPSLLVSPFAGVLIDRINKFRTMIFVQSVFMIGAFAIAALTLAGIVQVWHLVVLSVLMGITNAIDIPLRQSFVVQLVDDTKDLGNAISLNSSSFNLARLIGPAVAGLLIASTGEGICFLLNAISYIAVIWALFMMKIKLPISKKDKKLAMISEFKEGFKYVLESVQIRTIIIYLGITCMIGMSYPVIMPVFVREVLHANADVLGFLMSASGIGALIGALYLAGRKTIEGLEKWICIATLSMAFGLMGLAFTTNIFTSMSLTFFTGIGMVIIIAACNTMVQHLVDDDKRGRVMSIYTMAFMGTAPIGSLCGGAIAEKIGVQDTFLLTGITLIIAALVFSTQLKYFASAEEIVEEIAPASLDEVDMISEVD